MPAKSRRQQRYLYSKFGEAWVKAHHFDRIDTKTRIRRRKRKGHAR